MEKLLLTRDSIIFVHGLRGHPRETWTSRRQPENQDTLGASTHRQRFKSLFGSSSSHPKNGSSSLRKGLTIQQEQVFWPQDYLAEDLPQARVWTYGYEADVIGGLFRANSKDNVSQLGRNLAVRLERDIDNEVIISNQRCSIHVLNICIRTQSFLWLIVWAASLSKMYVFGGDFDDSRC